MLLIMAMPANLWLAHGAGAARLELDERQVWRYAEKLMKSREYFRAISEYRRLIHFFPESSHVPAAKVRIADAHLKGAQPGQAIAYLSPDVLQSLPSAHIGDALFVRGLAWLELEREMPYPLRRKSIGHALEDFRKIPTDWPKRDAVAKFIHALEQPPELPDKSPWLAGGLSAVIPGSGSFYVGRYAEGSLALFVNVLLIGATISSFEEDQIAVGTVLGALALAFYGGSIYSAVNGAHKFNAAANTGYLRQQRQRFGIVVGRGRIAAAFSTSF